MILADILKLIDSETELVITDGLSDVHRCIAATAPAKYFRRTVSFMSPSDIGGIHLRIVIQPEQWQ